MRISTQELRSLHQGEISRKRDASQKDCPSPHQIAALFGTTLSKHKRAEITDHIIECRPCADEFDSWRKLFQQRELLIEDLCSWAAHCKSDPDGKHIRNSRAGYVPFLPKEEASQRRRLWPYALAASAVFLGLLLVLGPKSVFKNSRQIPYRSSSSRKIELIRPRSGESIGRNAFFQWTPLAGADFYVLEIFNEALTPVWKSPELVQSRILVPPEIRQNWPSRKTYYWLVTAALADGRRIESRIGIFIWK